MTQEVTVHADGYDDQTLTIDETAPASVDVWLEPAGVAPTASPTWGAAGRKNGGHVLEKRRRTLEEALPANPY